MEKESSPKSLRRWPPDTGACWGCESETNRRRIGILGRGRGHGSGAEIPASIAYAAPAVADFNSLKKRKPVSTDSTLPYFGNVLKMPLIGSSVLVCGRPSRGVFLTVRELVLIFFPLGSLRPNPSRRCAGLDFARRLVRRRRCSEEAPYRRRTHS